MIGGAVVRSADRKNEPKLKRYVDRLMKITVADCDPATWQLLAEVRLVDTSNPRDLPLELTIERIITPMFRAAKMLPKKPTALSKALIATFATTWRANQKPEPVKRGRPKSKLIDILLVGVACIEKPKGTVRQEEYYAGIARRLGMNRKWYQIRHLHRQFLAKRKAGDCEVCALAHDDALHGVAALLRGVDKRAEIERREARHQQKQAVDAVPLITERKSASAA